MTRRSRRNHAFSRVPASDSAAKAKSRSANCVRAPYQFKVVNAIEQHYPAFASKVERSRRCGTRDFAGRTYLC